MRIFHFVETYDRGKRKPPICGAKTGHVTTFENVVTCKRCLTALRINRLKKFTRNMEGKLYQHHSFGLVRVITQPNYKAGGPRNVLIRTRFGQEVIVPQRSLRFPQGEGGQKKPQFIKRRPP